MKNKKIYLAGGFKSGWQDRIVELLPNHKFFDPRKHELDNPSDYTDWDLNAIRQSDLIIAFMEKGNPGGYALSLEIALESKDAKLANEVIEKKDIIRKFDGEIEARALDKKIILIDEHDDIQRKRYFEMVREVSDECYDSFDSFLSKIDVLEKYLSSD